MLSLTTRHSFRRSPYEVPSLHIDGHLVLDEIDAESVGLMVSNRSSTPTSISDWHMVLDEIDTTHDNLLTRTLNNDDSLSEEIISKYLKPSRVMSSDKNVLCSICQESFKDDEKVGRLDCDHEFHFSCIKSWLIIQNKCPNCRASAVGL